VKSRNLLAFVVSSIEIDPNKVQTIQVMPAFKTEKEVKGFLGCLNYIA
jgi:hypothetical protein